MGFEDLREFINALEKEGELLRVDGAHWDLEIGAIAELAVKRRGPALLFDNVVDYPTGFRVFSNGLLSSRRTAMALGLPRELEGLALVRAWRDKLGQYKPLPPVEVADGPVKRNVRTGAEVDLYQFPAPKWHSLDGGRYLGTGSCVIIRDPEEGWINIGTYRAMLQSKNQISVKMNLGKHGRIMLEKYHARGEPCPLVISFGQDPYLYLAASNAALPWGASEYDYAGWLKGGPVAVTAGVTTDLPVPANAEIVIEGEIPPDFAWLPEGPCGEWAGYYSDSSSGGVPVMTVKSVLFQDEPIIFGAPPFRPPSPYHLGLPMVASEIWSTLEKSGMSGITGVWIPANFDFPLALFVSLNQSYPGQARQVALLASSCPAARIVKLVVVVDSDVDITNVDEVLWVMLTRADLGETNIVGNLPTMFADPMIGEARRAIQDITTSRLIIDACRPTPWSTPFPPVNEFSPEYAAQVLEKWSHLFNLPKGG